MSVAQPEVENGAPRSKPNTKEDRERSMVS